MFLLKVIFAVLVCLPFIYLATYLLGRLYRDAKKKR